MEFVDLKAQYEFLKDDIQKAINKVFEHGQFINGPEVVELEKRLAEYTGTKNCIAVASGIDALMIALRSLDIGPGDGVFVPSFTFFATAEAVSLAGATPIFVDIEADSFNIYIHSLEEQYGKFAKNGKLLPKAIISVDLFGLPADYDSLETFALQHNLYLIEDAAQGLGGSYKGRKNGSFGKIATTSFFPAKPLGCYGDGGAIFTNDSDLANTIRSISSHGQGVDKYDNVRIGTNSRLDTIQAAILLQKITIMDQEILQRKENAKLYTEKLSDYVSTPRVGQGMESAWAQYSILSVNRDDLVKAFKQNDIPLAIYYRKSLHLQTAYKDLGYSMGDLEVSESVSNQILSLPIHPYLELNDIERVTNVICELVGLSKKYFY